MAYPDIAPDRPGQDVKFNLTDKQNNRISCLPDAEGMRIFQQKMLKRANNGLHFSCKNTPARLNTSLRVR